MSDTNEKRIDGPDRESKIGDQGIVNRLSINDSQRAVLPDSELVPFCCIA